MDRANSNSKERAARADCESVLLVTATKSQSSAWRKSKRVLRLSVERSPPEDSGRRRRLIMTAPPELDPDFGSETGIQGRSCSESPGGTNHSARVECGDQTGRSPVDLNSVAQVTTDNRRKTNCDARWAQVHRAIRMA
jgi:hypothetical protein